MVFVKDQLSGAEAGHDWFHVERVRRTALYLHALEKQGDALVVELGALLHDIADPKFHHGDEELGPRLAAEFLEKEGLDPERVEHLKNIIKHVGFKGGMKQDQISSIEFQIVQDADRMDALGAIGIARTFHYGGFKNRAIYDPSIPPTQYPSPEAYRKSEAPTINHFYEKLLKLKDGMHTQAGRQVAEERHRFMLDYLEHFYREWEGKA